MHHNLSFTVSFEELTRENAPLHLFEALQVMGAPSTRLHTAKARSNTGNQGLFQQRGVNLQQSNWRSDGHRLEILELGLVLHHQLKAQITHAVSMHILHMYDAFQKSSEIYASCWNYK